jgi:branched-chain amino acid transport system substrate-binding protein
MTLVAAMQKANSTDPAKYLPELSKISYDGVTAKIEFDEHGDTKNGAITLYQVKDGKLMPLATNVGGKTEKVGAADAAAPKSGMQEMKSDVKAADDKMKSAIENPKPATPANAETMKKDNKAQ